MKNLIKTTEEIKNYIAVDIDFSLKSILPDVAWIEEEYIKKYLGSAQFDELLTAYHSNVSLTPALGYLLEKVQLALLNLAYAKYTAIGSVSISNAGIRIQSDASNKTAFQWQVNEVNSYFLSKGFSALELLLSFLEENKASYPLWVNSTAYTVFKQYFINSASEFSGFYNIGNSRHTYLALVPIIQKVEELTLQDLLSIEYYDELKSQIAAGTLTTENKTIVRLIGPALAHMVIAKAIPELSLEISGSGIVVNQLAAAEGNSKVKSTATADLLSSKMNQAYTDSMQYLNRLTNYLALKATDSLYPLYYTNIILPAKEAAAKKEADPFKPSSIYSGF